MSSDQSPALLTFLGNPGSRYAGTRHNIGRMLLEHTPFGSQLSFARKFQGSYARLTPAHGLTGHTVHVLVPETYMNRAGISVSAAASFLKLEPAHILVAHDDMELPFGSCKTRTGGGLAGHNGLKSIRDRLGSAQFRRLRLGIGRPEHGSPSSFVLAPFSKDERGELDDYLERASRLLLSELRSGQADGS